MDAVLRRFAALVDLLSGLTCFVVWVAPLAFGRGAVGTVLAMMMLEFVLVHGTGFLGARPDASAGDRAKPTWATLGIVALYLLCVVAICLGFGQWWPLPVFAWLVAGKLLWFGRHGRVDAAESARQARTWAFSVVAYLAAVFAGLLLPLPRLGLTPDVVASLALPGSGDWIERPHLAVAGMAFYFFALAAYKWKTAPPR